MAGNTAVPRVGFNVREVAQSADVSESTVFSEIRKGELESMLIGDRRVITPEQISRWLERKAARARQKREGLKTF